ncbi:MAG: hypothetical protein GAK28_02418 [Luteibacter sp.]|uniref:hypothetical protein n=1 Tax=Luteibacter sp. TaxID=1886636 RepID=UPI001385EB88|nr:hypothetical protein [Luteibacter sp.]KAF1006742.1 MAG: hypothetical protein GAK28_02418 [Luteibacter sp.]
MTTAPDSATLASLIEAFRHREQIGIAKYGVTVDRTDLTHVKWLQHALEEDMDRCLYMQRAIDTAIALIAERDRMRDALNLIDSMRFDPLPIGWAADIAHEALQESVA